MVGNIESAILNWEIVSDMSRDFLRRPVSVGGWGRGRDGGRLRGSDASLGQRPGGDQAAKLAEALPLTFD